MAEFVIGIDIGGTKSHLALFDTDGKLIELGHWGCLNHEDLENGFDQFEEELKQFATQVISKHNISMKQIAYSVLGVAGVDTKQQIVFVSKILKKLGFEKFTLVNDAYLGIPAGSRTGIGICAINGTGCTLAGLNKKGEMLQIGGVGFVSADMGGGGYISERIVSAVYTELFRKGEPTVLTKFIFEKFKIKSKYEFVEKIYENMDNENFGVYDCAPMIFEALKKNDKVAEKIIYEISDNYANGICAMIEELKFPSEEELCVVLAGSVFVKGEHPLLVDSLKEKIAKQKSGSLISYNLLDVPNVAGSVIWALNTLTGKNNFYNKVCSQF